MEKKQCSIDWLIDQIKNVENQKNLTGAQWIDVVEQAKAMHKEDVEDAYFKGYADNMNDEGDFEQYYNETYKGGEQ